MRLTHMEVPVHHCYTSHTEAFLHHARAVIFSVETLHPNELMERRLPGWRPLTIEDRAAALEHKVAPETYDEVSGSAKESWKLYKDLTSPKLATNNSDLANGNLPPTACLSDTEEAGI